MERTFREKIELVGGKDNVRLDQWLTSNLTQFSRSYIKKLIDKGMVKVNGIYGKANYKIKENDRIQIFLPQIENNTIKAEKLKLDILYEDNSVLVINKGKDMVVHPAAGNWTGTLVNAVMYHCRDNLSDINGITRPGIVHRIDKDTTGVLVIAKNNRSHRFLSDSFKEHKIKRVYNAIVDGVVGANSGKIDAPIGRHPVNRKKMAVTPGKGRHAITHFNVKKRFTGTTFLELRLETGRTHQIRVHMSYIGHPVLGDYVYGKKHSNKKYFLETQLLHARILGFTHPETGKYLEFDSGLPGFFEKFMDKLV